MAVSITICNLALGDIRAPEIQDIDDPSLEAQMCARYYPHCLAVLIDDYSWQFTKRVTNLVKMGVNERSTEWAYAYALPDGCGQALRLIPTGASTGEYVHWEYPAYPQWYLSFIVENNILYAQIADARLEYATSDVEEVDMPPMFREALRKLLAANLAVPIRDSRELEGDMLKQAEAARQSAIANDMNRAPMREPVDDILLVRR